MIHTDQLQAELKKGWSSTCGVWTNETLAERCGLPDFTIIARRNPHAWEGPHEPPYVAKFKSGPFVELRHGYGKTRYQAAERLIVAAMAIHAKADVA